MIDEKTKHKIEDTIENPGAGPARWLDSAGHGFDDYPCPNMDFGLGVAWEM